MQRLLPPTLVLALLAAMVTFAVLLPLAGPLALPVRLAGAAVAVLGVLLSLGGSRAFARAGTNIKAFDDPGSIVTSGLFAFSRNPMYLGFVVLLAGVALALGVASAAIGPAGFWLAADRWYIPFEERRMRATFGSVYDAYRRRVPRWVGPVRSRREEVTA